MNELYLLASPKGMAFATRLGVPARLHFEIIGSKVALLSNCRPMPKSQAKHRFFNQVPTWYCDERGK